MQDSSQPVMSVDEITRRLEELDAALRVVESEGRDLEEKIRQGITDVALLQPVYVNRVYHMTKCV